jgi:hypothetical protein
MKTCNICNIEKGLEFFYKRKDSSDGFRKECKDCCNLRNKKYVEENKESIKEYKKKFYQSNKEVITERSKQWRVNNIEASKDIAKRYFDKESTRIIRKEYYQKNKEYYSLKNKEYKKLNKEKLNEYHRVKYKSDIIYRLKYSVRGIIYKSIKRGGYIKKSKSAEILDCTFEYFKTHIESKFEYWMSWENHGLYNGELNYGWDIDHIIPLGSAKTEEDIIKLNHYTNLQPLCSKINRDIKRDKLWNYSSSI